MRPPPLSLPQLRSTLIACSAAMLVACGGSSSSPSTPQQPAPAPQAPALPTLSSPVTDAQDKQALLRETRTLDALPVESITAHRTAALSYGSIAPEAPRLQDHALIVNGNVSGYLSTGLYVPPGERVTVTVPPQLVGQGYTLRISGHSDELPLDQKWSRMPRGIQRSFPLTSATTVIASPYGGALYIDVGDGADGKAPRQLGQLNIRVSGALQAPYFVLGQTTQAQWLASLRQAPAPYAELVTPHLAVSVPSAMVRELSDPESLLRYWDDVVALQDWVGGTEAYRTGPDRINMDVQISAGYLHSGYPIQGPASVDSSKNWMNLQTLRQEGEWGYFHELGHEMQQQSQLWSGWYEGNGFTPSGQVEVTVNIFAKAALDRMAPFADPQQGSGWGWAPHPGRVLQKAVQTLNDTGKPRFADKDPYPFYFSLADGLGWNAYRAVLSSYVEDARVRPEQFPRTDAQKRDQWLIRWSRVTGFDMVDYMVTRWRWPASAEAIATVRAMNLPTWMPATTRLDNFQMPSNESRVLDLRNTGFDLTGPAAFVRVTAGPKLQLLENKDGTFTARGQPGMTGRDALSVVYRSQAGHEVTTSLKIELLATP